MIRTHRHLRRGISTLWLILALPVFLTLLVFTVDISNLWLARAELENGLEAAALAAVEAWGRSGNVISTAAPRDVGVKYAAANMIRGKPIAIGLNLAPAPAATNPNRNLTCCASVGNPPGGNLIFGTITENDPLTFDAGKRPSCGVGTVLFDMTKQGTTASDNAWGIAFFNSLGTPPDLRIASITIDLQGGGGSGVFMLPFIVSNRGSSSEPSTPPGAMPPFPDTEGLEEGQVEFEFDSSHPNLLKIVFSDGSFAPGDRLRFKAGTDGVGKAGDASNGGQGAFADDGDGVGYDKVRVYVTFKQGGNSRTTWASFVDHTESSNDCAGLAPIVHPSGIPFLPCPPSSAPKNNGQSYVLMSGSGNNDFAVRAQAIVEVDSLARKLLGNCIGPYYVTVKTTARYNCSEDRAWLVRVERFLCPGSTP
jgi:hypothetical protein